MVFQMLEVGICIVWYPSFTFIIPKVIGQAATTASHIFSAIHHVAAQLDLSVDCDVDAQNVREGEEDEVWNKIK